MARIVLGKTVFTELEELVDRRWTALLLIDVQNYDCSPDGPAAKAGRANANLAMVERLAVLASEARLRSIPLIYLQNSFRANGFLNSPADLSRRVRLWGEDCLPTIPGNWNHQIVDSLSPHPSDLVIPKSRQSGFYGTPLDSALRSRSIHSLVITGTATQGCVESTVRDALARDYYVVLPEDCAASTRPDLHACSIKVMKGLVHLMTKSDAIISSWRSSYEPSSGCGLNGISNNNVKDDS